jgi:3'-5' exoribonuclease
MERGQAIDDVFVVRQKRQAYKKDGDAYLSLVVADRSGSVNAVAWDNVAVLSKTFAAGDYVRILGAVGEYQDAPQLVVHSLQRMDPAQVEATDFIPATDRDVDRMLEQLVDVSRTVGNTYLSRLLNAFFEDHAFVDLLKKAPAAKKMHHAYLGGLLEHTLSVVLLIQAIASHYKGVDRDLLLTGGILHDIGKVHEFSYKSHIDYSDPGRLLNHIVIGVEMLKEKIDGLEDFPEDLALLLKHMIVSHHGTRDFGSPEPPMTLEAIILNYVDDLDAKVTAVRTFMEAEAPEATWTSYHRVLDRFFYKGKREDADS